MAPGVSTVVVHTYLIDGVCAFTDSVTALEIIVLHDFQGGDA